MPKLQPIKTKKRVLDLNKIEPVIFRKTTIEIYHPPGEIHANKLVVTQGEQQLILDKVEALILHEFLTRALELEEDKPNA